MPKPDLSVIIVHYKTPALLVQCVESVYRETKLVKFEIIIVDNHSEDNSRELILEKFPYVVWIQMNKNEGFASGNNAGIAQSKGDYILLLNSDTIVLDGAIDRSFLFLKSQQDSSIAVLGCRLLNEDHTVQNSCHTKNSWPRWNVLPQNILFGKLRSLSVKQNKTPNLSGEIHFTDAVSGAFVLFRKDILKKSGPLDPDFFFYFEEIEWQKRIVQEGYKIIFYSEAGIIHLGGASSAKSPSSRQSNYSAELFILKASGTFRYFLFLVLSYVNLLTGIVLFIFLSAESKKTFIEWRKKFAPLSRHHLKLLFIYRKRTGSFKPFIAF